MRRRAGDDADRRGLTRRDVLKLGVAGGAAVLLPIERTVRAKGPSRMAASKLPKPFKTPFAAPPIAVPVRRTADTDIYALDMTEFEAEIVPGYRTRLWGYSGSVPGPTIDAVQGRKIVVRHANRLDTTHPALGYRPATSVHLHGSASLPQYDGYASDVTQIGSFKDYQYPNSQPARTLWYHDHGVHQTAASVYMGLAAMYRMTDANEQSLPLPRGPYDVPLIVSDAVFDTSGQLMWDDNSESGLWGDVVLVNGRPWPTMKVEARRYRFRLLAATVSRSFRWALDSGDPFTVISTDGGLMPRPQRVTSFRQAGGERYDVIVDFSKYAPGKKVMLKNLSNKNNRDEANTGKVMMFEVVARTGVDQSAIPDVLDPVSEVMALQPSQSVATRRLRLERSNSRWTVNGTTWDKIVESGFTHVEANPQVGDVEIWELENSSGGWFHPTHIHLIDFRILDRNGKPPMPHELGPKDVVYLGENETVRVLTRFGPNPGKYMVHCHNLVHEDHDMMTQFEVGAGGDDPMGTPGTPLPGTPL